MNRWIGPLMYINRIASWCTVWLWREVSTGLWLVFSPELHSFLLWHSSGVDITTVIVADTYMYILHNFYKCSTYRVLSDHCSVHWNHFHFVTNEQKYNYQYQTYSIMLRPLLKKITHFEKLFQVALNMVEVQSTLKYNT